MFRRGNTTPGSSPHLPMRKRIILQIAKLAEVDLKGIQIEVVSGTKGIDFKGYTRSRKCIELYEDAFESATLEVKMGSQISSLEKWLPITNQIYTSGKPIDLVACPHCKNKSLHVEIQPYPEGDVTLYFECFNCGLVDHISHMPVPDWLKPAIIESAMTM